MARSLYDAYRLNNSQAIPVYNGSAAPEALQVGQYMQGLYDTAQAGTMGIDNGLQSLTALPQDAALANDLRNRTQGKLSEFAKRGDYENLVPAVTQLGQEFANRYRELQTPIAQRAAYIKSLDDKELNLTAYQKEGLRALSDSGYRGLQRDGSGRYVGQYMGETADRNMDVNKWVDDRLKDFAIQKGGSEIQNTNGQWMIKYGSKWEKLDPGTIENALSAAAANSADLQGYKNMMGRIAGHSASKVWADPNRFADSITVAGKDGKPVAVPNTAKLQILSLAKQYGISTADAGRLYTEKLTKNSIDSNLLQYAKTKYAVNNRWSESGLQGADPYALKAYDPKANPLGEVDLVTGAGFNVGNRLGANADEMLTRANQSQQNMQAARTYVDQQKQRVARATGTDVSKLDHTAVTNWLASHDNQELGKYRSNVEAVAASQRDISDINQVRDAAMDAAVKKATGNQYTFNQLKESATKQFQDAVRSGKIDTESLWDRTTEGQSLLSGPGGIPRKAGITRDNVSNFEVIDGEKHTLGSNLLTLRDKTTGKVVTVASDSKSLSKSDIGNDKAIGNISNSFRNINWKDTYKEGLGGLNSNSVWMTLPRSSNDNGKVVKSTLGNRVEDVLRASSGALSVKDLLDNDLGTGDVDRVKALIAAGQFDALGIGRDPKTGQRRVQLSVVMDPDAKDPQDRYKTIMVGADTNIWDRIAGSVMSEGAKHMHSESPAAQAAARSALEFGNAFRTGSSFETVPKLLPGQSMKFTDQSGSQYRIVPNLTGASGNAKSYEILKNNAGQWQTVGHLDSDIQISNYADKLKAQNFTVE